MLTLSERVDRWLLIIVIGITAFAWTLFMQIHFSHLLPYSAWHLLGRNAFIFADSLTRLIIGVLFAAQAARLVDVSFTWVECFLCSLFLIGYFVFSITLSTECKFPTSWTWTWFLLLLATPLVMYFCLNYMMVPFAPKQYLLVNRVPYRLALLCTICFVLSISYVITQILVATPRVHHSPQVTLWMASVLTVLAFFARRFGTKILFILWAAAFTISFLILWEIPWTLVFIKFLPSYSCQ